MEIRGPHRHDYQFCWPPGAALPRKWRAGVSVNKGVSLRGFDFTAFNAGGEERTAVVDKIEVDDCCAGVHLLHWLSGAGPQIRQPARILLFYPAYNSTGWRTVQPLVRHQAIRKVGNRRMRTSIVFLNRGD